MRALSLFLLVVPLAVSSRTGQEHPPPDSSPPEPKLRFAMLDDVKILANGLLQLGHGLKDFVHKTKSQINDIFQKLNIFDKSFYDLSLQTNEIKEEERALRKTTSSLQARNEEMKNISLELNSKLEELLEEKGQLQQKVRVLEEKLVALLRSQPQGQDYQEVTFLKTFVEQQDQSIKELFQTVHEQYQQLTKQHSQIKEMENQLRRTGFQETTDNSFSSKQRAPRTLASLQPNGTHPAEPGDGPADCAALYEGGLRASGIYPIRPSQSEVFNVYCDVKSGGSWTVIQHRMDGSQNFNETWEKYQHGFGSLDGEFWLGLEKIYSIVKQSDYILRIELEDWKDNRRSIEYALSLGSKETDYTLHLSEILGNIPSAIPEHKDLAFSTWDHNAKNPLHCPESHSGGWWWDEDVCGETNLNGQYNRARLKGRPERRRGLSWKSPKGRLYSVKTTRMLIHPTDLESFE